MCATQGMLATMRYRKLDYMAFGLILMCSSYVLIFLHFIYMELRIYAVQFIEKGADS